ncbi:hypothetical protein GGR55DRAFT_680940 [Xylaria sp. FL0064]|nr:hypothetical protein GGR55DRAFT_680940 [Xylaria sp. FL0064]
MECQTCSEMFPNAESLREHVGFFQSRIQYHIRELLECLAHASPRSENHSAGGADNDNAFDNNSDDGLGNGEEEEQDDTGTLHCPLQAL